MFEMTSAEIIEHGRTLRPELEWSVDRAQISAAGPGFKGWGVMLVGGPWSADEIKASMAELVTKDDWVAA